MKVYAFSLFVFASACGGAATMGPDEDDDPPEPPPAGGEYLLPNVIHTGFTSGYTFQAVLGTNLLNPTWSVSDPSRVTFEEVDPPPGYSDRFIKITTLATGTVTITATEGSQSASSNVTIAAYTAGQLDTGDTRYNNPANANNTDRRACASCHQAPGGADHSPFAVGGFEDPDILQAIQTGTYAHGQSLEVNGFQHAWNLTAGEANGIVPFLRTLPPRGF